MPRSEPPVKRGLASFVRVCRIMAMILAQLIQTLGKLPGLGPRSGRRVALHLLKKRTQVLSPLIRLLQQAYDTLTLCQLCGCWDETDPCHLCSDPTRDSRTLCVVTDMGDVWAFERSGCYKGQYHVLGGVLSALEGVGPDQLRIEALLERCKKTPPQEIILALNPTVEGQATAHYVMQELDRVGVTAVTSLARGIPLGGELDYLDEGTLTAAFAGRKSTEL